MKTLLLLRHAKSSWNNPSQKDHERPLNSRGKRDAPRMGQLLKQEGLTPDLIISSTAVRARTTAASLAERAEYGAGIEIHEELYHAPPQQILHVIQEIFTDPDVLLVVGHNPGMEELASRLAREVIDFPTAALAQFALDIAGWEEVTLTTDAILVNYWRPRELTDF